MSIKVEQLTKAFGKQRAVDDISFEVGAGEIVGFLGPNGAGKSTTMKMITTYLPPSDGNITVCGHDVRNNAAAVKRHIGYLPEQNPLYTDMYVKEYLNFIGSLHGLKGSHLRERVEKMLDICGLRAEQHKVIGALSKGYRQRVGLAQALIHDPEVLILDEPTSGFDPNQIIEIRHLIKTISAKKTVLFSTHIMQEVQALCHRVIVINKGKIVANQTMEDIKKYSASQKIIVAFEEPVDHHLIENLPGVISCEAADSNYTRFTLVTTSGKELRGALYQLAKEKEWNLLELRQEETGLEEIFQNLTTS